MRRPFVIFLIILVLFQSPFTPRAATAQEVVTVVLIRDGDSITLYISNEGLISLEGLTIQSTTTQGEQLSRRLDNYPAFIGLPFDRIVGPACFVLENSSSPVTLPLECQSISPSHVYRQKLTPANLIWYDSVALAQRLIVITQGVDVMGRCPAEQAECEIPFLPPSPGTPTAPPPTKSATYEVIPLAGTAVVSRSTPFRNGPGPQYAIIATVSGGTYAVTGRNADGTYYQVDYNGQEAWVTAFAQGVQFTIAEMTATPDTSVTPLDSTLTLGQTVNGVLNRNQKTNYQFIGKAGELISIVVDARFDSYLEFRDKQNFLLAEDDNSGGNNNAQIDGFIIPTNGEYRIVLRGYGARDVGPFKLTLLKGKVPPKEVAGDDGIRYGQKITDALTPNGQSVKLFNGTEGDVISILVQADFDSYVQLQDAAGKVLVSDDDSGGNGNPLIELFKLPATGQYKIVLRGHSARASGTYTLSLLQGFSSGDQVAIEYGTTLDDRIASGERKIFVFEGSSGDWVSASVQSQFDAHMTLRDERGAVIIDDDDSGGNLQPAIQDVKLPSKGTYFLVIFGNGQDDKGPFSVTLSAR